MNAPSASPGSPHRYPKGVRLLRPAEFRKVYDQGWRHTCPLFAAFCLRDGDAPARFGFTLPRAFGKAVFRNRARRRLREVVRVRREKFPAGLLVVFNPRRAANEASPERLAAEVERLIERCRR